MELFTFSNVSNFLFGESTYEARINIEGIELFIVDDSAFDNASGGIA